MRPYLMKVDEVMERLSVSRATAYSIIKRLNQDLQARGLKTLPGKVHSGYFEEEFALASSGSMHMKFVDFVDVYANDIKPRLRESTWESKELMITNKLVPFFGRIPMKDIRPIDIIIWQNKMMGEDATKAGAYSPTYFRTINNQLVAILNHAERFYGLDPNPCKKAPKIGSKKTAEMKIWTKAEYLAFSKAVADKLPTFYAFEVLYWTGIRLGELLAFTPSDFDFAKSTLSITKSMAVLKDGYKVTPPKTEKSERTIAMCRY